MDSNPTQLCRLCLQFSDDFVNIFDTFEDSTIASILTKHFWFEVNKNDGFTEWLCQICCMHTKIFHIYYKRMESFQRNYYKSSDLVGDDLIESERSVSPREEALELDLNIVKCEEMELTEVDTQISKENSSDYNDDCDESENTQTSEDEDQSSRENPKNDDVVDINATESQKLPPLPPNIKRKKYRRYSRRERDKQDVQIREFCTMKCELCSNVEFETLLEAKNHYRCVHKTTGYVRCCGKKLFTRYNILCHIVVHVNPDAYRCDQCGKRLRDRRTFKLHIDSHKSLERAYKCSLCSSSFKKEHHLNSHVENKHKKNIGITTTTKHWKCAGDQDMFISKLISEGKIHNDTKPSALQKDYPAMFGDFSVNVVRNHLNDFKRSVFGKL